MATKQVGAKVRLTSRAMALLNYQEWFRDVFFLVPSCTTSAPFLVALNLDVRF
jgi:hypothetical protein